MRVFALTSMMFLSSCGIYEGLSNWGDDNLPRLEKNDSRITYQNTNPGGFSSAPQYGAVPQIPSPPQDYSQQPQYNQYDQYQQFQQPAYQEQPQYQSQPEYQQYQQPAYQGQQMQQPAPAYDQYNNSYSPQDYGQEQPYRSMFDQSGSYGGGNQWSDPMIPPPPAGF